MDEVHLEGNSPQVPRSFVAESLEKEVANAQEALAALSQLERKCSEAFQRIEHTASQVCSENYQLRLDLLKLSKTQGLAKGTLSRANTQPLLQQAKLPAVRSTPSRNGWMSEDSPPNASSRVNSPDAQEGLERSPKRFHSAGTTSSAIFSSKASSSSDLSQSSPRKEPSRAALTPPAGWLRMTAQGTDVVRLQSSQNVRQQSRGWLWRSRRAGLFPDLDKLKKQTVQAVALCTDLKGRTRTSGLLQAIVKSRAFEWFSLAMAAFSVFWLAVEAEHNAGQELFDSPALFQLVEYALCSFFCIELLIRFLACGKKSECLQDNWFQINCVLVLIMIVETWIVPVLVKIADVDRSESTVSGISSIRFIRILRMARMVRAARLLMYLPGTSALARGAATAVKPLLLMFLLLFLVLYAFAVVFAQMAGDLRVGHMFFGSMVDSMVTLLLRGTLPSLAEVVYEIGQESHLLAALFLVFAVAMLLIFVQILVGLSAHLAFSVATLEKERLAAELVRSKLLLGMRSVGLALRQDAGPPEPLSQREFEAMLQDPKAAKALREAGVEPLTLQELVSVAPPMADGRKGLFGSDGQQLLSFEDLLGTALALRGSNLASQQDLVNFRYCIASQLRVPSISSMQAGIVTIREQLGELTRSVRQQYGPMPGQRSKMRAATVTARRPATMQGTPSNSAAQGLMKLTEGETRTADLPRRQESPIILRGDHHHATVV